MSLFSLTCLITSFLSFGFGLFISLNRKRSPDDAPIRLWVAFCVAVGCWSLGLGMMTAATSVETAKIWLKIHYLGAIFIPTLYLHFVLAFLEKKHLTLIVSCYAITFVFQILNFLGHLVDAIPTPPFNFYTVPGRFYNIYSLYFLLAVVYSNFLLISAVRKATGFKKNQIYFLFLGTGLGFGGGSTAFFPVYNIPIFPFGVPLTAVYVFIVGYSILIYRLMDFSLVVRWALAVAVSLMIAAGVWLITVGTIEYFNKSHTILAPGLPSILAACITVFVFDVLRKRIGKKIDNVIFRSPDFQLLLDGIENLLLHEKSLEELTAGLREHLKAIFAVDHVGFGIWDPKSVEFRLFPLNAFAHEIISKTKSPITQTDFLVKTIETERRLFKYGVVTEEELTAFGDRAHQGEKITFWKIRRTMRWLGASACTPLMDESRLLGFIVLGKKAKNSYYTEEDKKFLSHVCEMVAQAIRRHVFETHLNTV
jgi:hypothetical protein